MKRSPRAAGWATMVAACAAAATGLALVPAGPALATARPSATGPTLRLIATQHAITVQRFGKRVYLDPGVYVTAFGSALEFDVQRASYAQPLTITQVIHGADGSVLRRALPARVLDGWIGLRRFLQVTVRNTHGAIVGTNVVPFCPNSYNPQRATPASPQRTPYPLACYSNPFGKATVWGIQRGWGVDPIGSGGPIFSGPGPAGNGGSAGFPLKIGKYDVTVRITAMWRRLLHVTARDAVATVRVKVVKGQRCAYVCPPVPRGPAPRPAPLPRLPLVPTMASPPASVLPDLTPLPSWGISVQNHPATKRHSQSSVLSFGATVWIGGHSRLDVQGFRSHGSPIMTAYQYFWRNGHVIGRARAGTMGFDTKKGHDHWHFQQFAQYRLLNASKSVVLDSRKVGFCIAPTDAIDLLVPHAQWQPTYTGFGGACGSPSALWVQEMLPLGWGDTYVQSSAGQAFDISALPNGVYYIEIIANPRKVLHESSYANDISLRKVILGGTPGSRTVKVPAVHGIDPEG